ncbi:uncharacterized protein MELLADRAFT_103360 [Melampsora larici-populina 98AG31]|uniref:Uncharacterized protein n=1 Tax=Melampsora larici-populina (strain 98AG31 / pathotype 3-4-7) TaxID=747676 RepID=F4RB78_MELLP|nr:uncharacterized protein MELLADRAFT_103360 [Melampsora larici-populina 98AG31]EGG10033.1 hypothetical protein MELLADRAFT_103360 [Melampsora larici-populina 98AG31]
MSTLDVAFGLAVPLTAIAMGVCWDKAHDCSSERSIVTIFKIYSVAFLGGVSLILMTLHNCAAVTTAKRIGPELSPMSKRLSEIPLPFFIACAQLSVNFTFLQFIYKRTKSKVTASLGGGLSLISFLAGFALTIINVVKQNERMAKRAAGRRVNFSSIAVYDDFFRVTWLFSALLVNAWVCGMTCLYRFKFDGSGTHLIGERSKWLTNAGLILFETSLLNFILSFILALISTKAPHRETLPGDSSVLGAYIFFKLILIPSLIITITWTLEKKLPLAPSQSSEFKIEFNPIQWSDKPLAPAQKPSITSSQSKKARHISVHTTTSQTIWG